MSADDNFSGDDASKKKVHVLQDIAGELLKRAVTLGAATYVSAEDKVSRTMASVQTPIHLSKSMIKELIDSFVESYTVEIKATISFNPRKKTEKTE
jgi:hypothetical protein